MRDPCFHALVLVSFGFFLTWCNSFLFIRHLVTPRSLSGLLFFFFLDSLCTWGFPGGSDGKESTFSAGGLIWSLVWSLVEKIPRRREWQLTPVFLPGESHEQRSLAGYSPWSYKESGTAQRLTLCTLRCQWWMRSFLKKVNFSCGNLHF